MSQASRRNPGDHYRASDADRDVVLAELSEHFQAGRLTQEEFSERSDQALRARTYGELATLMSDLPHTSPAVPPQAPQVSPQPPEQWTPGGRPALAPAIVAVFTFVLALGVLLSMAGHHGSGLWWAIIVIPLVLRGVFCRRGRGRSRRW